MDDVRFRDNESSSTTMSTNQSRGFNAATDVLAFMQAFSTDSVGGSSEAVRPPHGGSHRLRSLVRRHRATPSRSA
jgi:hypothetical protein